MDTHKGRLLRDVLVALEQAGHRTCILHGYEGYPEHVGSDVDTITENPTRVPLVLHDQHVATVVQASGYKGNYTDFTFLLYKRYEDEPVFLTYDAAADYRFRGAIFFGGEEFLRARRPFKFFKVPPADLEFCSYLVRKVMKGSLDEAQSRRLTQRYAEDPAGCEEQLGRFFAEATAKLIVDSARTGDWEPVRSRLEPLRDQLLHTVARGQSPGLLLYRFRTVWRRLRPLIHPPGLMVAFLGVDGAGKSTVMERIERDLASAFARTKAYHKRTFPSALNWIRRRWGNRSHSQAHRANSESSISTRHGEHRRPPRKFAGSLAKLLFWWLDYTLLGYVMDVYPSLTRSTLVLFDRYYHDLLVDARRYRYGGPSWAITWMSRLIPRPDLIILLDASPEVLYARKQEATFADVSRQREAYLNVVEGLPNGHVVDSSKPLDEVISETEQIILDHLAERAARRFRRQK